MSGVLQGFGGDAPGPYADDPARVKPVAEFLTADERQFVRQAGELYNLACTIVGSGDTRSADVTEFAFHIHGLQHLVMAQAAARAYPGEFRLLGESRDD